MVCPMALNLTVRRRDTAHIISQDPWSITAYRHGETQDDAVITYTMTGTLMPASSSAIARAVGYGESPVGMSRVLLLLEYDADVLQAGDEVRAVQVSTGVARDFVVVTHLGRCGFKQEIILSERD